jgi:hypothetical protein
MPRPFQARKKGVVAHPVGGSALPYQWPARLSEYIIFAFVRDIHDMKSDINVRKQTASKLDPRNGNVQTATVLENIRPEPQFFPVDLREPIIMFVWFLKLMAHSFNLQCRT